MLGFIIYSIHSIGIYRFQLKLKIYVVKESTIPEQLFRMGYSIQKIIRQRQQVSSQCNNSLHYTMNYREYWLEIYSWRRQNLPASINLILLINLLYLLESNGSGRSSIYYFFLYILYRIDIYSFGLWLYIIVSFLLLFNLFFLLTLNIFEITYSSFSISFYQSNANQVGVN